MALRVTLGSAWKIFGNRRVSHTLTKGPIFLASRTMLTMPSLNSMGKLEAIRAMMKEREVNAYVVPSEDAHASEYLAPCDARRAHLTSFDGSAGTAVITQNEARCWTDGRYWLQAEKQLGEGWTLVKHGLPDVPTWGKWLKDELPSHSKVGIDPSVLPFSEYQGLSKSLAEDSNNSTLVPLPDNLVDIVWSDRPARPSNPVFELAEQYTGQSTKEKLQVIQDKLGRIGSPGMVVGQLDEVAWLFNLRGSDIPYNPVFFSHAIITPTDCRLFVQPSSLSSETKSYLKNLGVLISPYNDFWTSLQKWGEQVRADRISQSAPGGTPSKSQEEKGKAQEKEEKVVKTDKVIIGNKTSWAVAQAIGENHVEARKSIIEEAKAKKNPVEIEGFRQANIRDGAALVRYFAWLEEALENGEEWTEYDAASKLEDFRKENKWFKGLSFDTISSTGANAAVIHYKPPGVGSLVIDRNAMYLCDSGGQYLDGTTDTTRTWHFGTPSDEEKRAFTRVLQGHIALDTMIFPHGTTGYILDAIARRPLWSDGLDYRHGTGHGVGSFLNVHEGPQGIGLRIAYNDTALQIGHVLSNEPGYYADGKWGIRIENVVVTQPAETSNNFGDKGYLRFEHFTMCPISTKLVVTELLSATERTWLTEYHVEVKAKVAPMLRDEFKDDRALKWLEKECKPIQ